MITLKDFMETVDYRITEGSEYCWNSFGPNAYQIDSWNQEHGEGGYSISVVFDTVDQTVYNFEAWDYTSDRCYRWINPNYIEAYKQECVERDIEFTEAFDDVKFIDLDLAKDMLEKARAIVTGEDYDERVMIEVNFSDDELLTYMKLAHERDMTFNAFVEEALQHAIEEFRKDPEGAVEKAQHWKRLHETGTDNPIDFPIETSKPRPAKMTANKKGKK
jgi:hypothetical protein